MRWLAMTAFAAACSGEVPATAPNDGRPATNDGALVDAPPGGLESGSLDVQWMHGSASCTANTDPELQVHRYNATTYILRQNKCDTFEAPFIYLLLGSTKALLLDTGATGSISLPNAVMPLVGNRALVVAHTHAHGDHRSGDTRFANLPNTIVIAPDLAAVRATFGIEPWPADPGSYDLGDRVLDVIGLPGHEQTHIVIYDRNTGLLLTGDSLYPGLLFIDDWSAYRASISRLAQFANTRPISYVLGAHIEMTSTPMQPYAYGETYQPNEHVLQLTAAHVTELDAALTQLGATPPASAVRYDDFVIVPP